MSSIQPAPCPDAVSQSRWSGARGRTLLVLGMVAVLVGTNYTALTNDTFRKWAVGRQLSRSVTADNPVAAGEDPRLVEAWIREAALKAQVNALKGSVAALTVDAAALRNANASLLAREKLVSARLLDSEKKRLAGVVAARRLGSRMKARVAKGVSRQLATLPGKVLPAIGATVSVASTILDLHDLCESMQDMAALNADIGLPPVDSREVCGVQIGTVQTVVDNAKKNFAATYDSAMRAAGLASPPAAVPGPALPGMTVQPLPAGAPPTAAKANPRLGGTR